MKITLEGTGHPGLDGEYEVSPEPSTREIRRFAKEAALSPSEMTEVLSVGAIEVVPFYVFTAMQRQGRGVEAAALLDLPFDTWGNADVIRDEPDAATDDDGAPESEEDLDKLPPTVGSGSSGSEPTDNARSGTTSLESSGLPA